ncbi:NAD(+) diphosphatase [Actinomycetaceae bacterium TAE3-ERU4]|nr:NAD(+) diphosphatase [Actinomycetaceae bacterium TAE3-ERU4]
MNKKFPLFPLSGALYDSNSLARTRKDFLDELYSAKSCSLLLASADGFVCFREIIPSRREGNLEFLLSGQGAYLGKSPQGEHFLASFVTGFEGTQEAFDLRQVTHEVEPAQVAAACAAVALASWNFRTRYCERCANPLLPLCLGWEKECTSCKALYYPRTDPAVIMTVFDEQGRLLLANNTRWERTRFSLLAGYVDAGESPETTVLREVFEEVGLRGEGIPRILGTSPWPFPRSLMLVYRLDLGLSARQVDAQLRVDGKEIREAAFFTRKELEQDIARGRVTLPARSSVAYALITRWLRGEEIA